MWLGVAAMRENFSTAPEIANRKKSVVENELPLFRFFMF